MSSRYLACLAIATLWICLPVAARTDETATCTSPDGQNVIALKLTDGQPQYDVTYAGQVTLSLSFLETGTEYQATVFSDVKGSRNAQRELNRVTSACILDVVMEPRGGLAVILDPATTP